MYTTDRVAQIIGLAPFTVRKMCRDGRITATKLPAEGHKGQWRISHDEVRRLVNERYGR